MFNIWYQQGLNRVEALGVALLEDTALVFVRWLLTASLLLLVLIYLTRAGENFSLALVFCELVGRGGCQLEGRGGCRVEWRAVK